MGRITIDNLSRSLKEYLTTLGLTEEQVNELLQQLIIEKIGNGNLNHLTTEDKSSLVAAINELNSKIGTGLGNLTTLYNDTVDYL